MFICDEKFREAFRTDWKAFVHEVPAGETLNVLQISDIHWKRGVARDQIEGELEERLKAWRGCVPEKRIDGLVLSGDIIDGSDYATKVPDPAAREQAYKEAHESAADVIAKLISTACELHEPEQRKRVLAVAGNHDVLRTAARLKSPKTPKSWESFAKYFGSRFTAVSASSDAAMLNNPRACLLGNRNGVVALLGLDSNYVMYQEGPGRLGKWQEHGMVNSLQVKSLGVTIQLFRDIIKNCPLYVFVVLHHHLLPAWRLFADQPTELQKDLRRVTLNTRSIVDTLQDHKVSLVLHGHMHLHVVQQVSYVSMHLGVQRFPLHIVGCGQYESGKKDCYQSSIVSVDLCRGDARVVFFGDEDGHPTTQPIGAPLPLTSASRVPAREMRLYREADDWLHSVESKAPAFRALFDERWATSGYVQVCGGTMDGHGAEIPFPADPETLEQPRSRYLLLLLKDAETILLNNHRPLRESEHGYWDTLLLPAFVNIRDIIENLRRDMSRTRERLRLDPAKAVDKRDATEQALEKLLATLSEEDWVKRQAELRFVGRKPFVKFSPTAGAPRLYQYSLVTFDGFSVAGSRFANLFDHLELPAGHMKTVDLRRLDPGYHWVSLKAWRECASILARNQDVMRWVEEVVALRVKEEGGVPGWMADKMATPHLNPSIHVQERFFFDRGPAGRDASMFPRTLRSGLEAMEFEQGPFAKKTPAEAPYRGCTIEQVHLVRTKRRGRDQICVFPLGKKRRLGILRPTQRFVLEQGLARAGRLLEVVTDYFKRGADKKGATENPLDFDGYLILKTAGGAQIAHLPPIIETIDQTEWENSDGIQEFLVCDGNHRIVQHCWLDGKTVRAILISQPKQRYYAFPFSANEWWLTARNRLSVPPADPWAKYAPRDCPEAPGPLSYRAYYRDFSTQTGFQDVGGQGGCPG